MNAALDDRERLLFREMAEHIRDQAELRPFNLLTCSMLVARYNELAELRHAMASGEA